MKQNIVLEFCGLKSASFLLKEFSSFRPDLCHRQRAHKDRTRKQLEAPRQLPSGNYSG
jgi:hypothetical protein